MLRVVGTKKGGEESPLMCRWRIFTEERKPSLRPRILGRRKKRGRKMSFGAPLRIRKKKIQASALAGVTLAGKAEAHSAKKDHL